jgi:hypothetical protein
MNPPRVLELAIKAGTAGDEDDPTSAPSSSSMPSGSIGP